jgi:hypothetical protein
MHPEFAALGLSELETRLLLNDPAHRAPVRGAVWRSPLRRPRRQRRRPRTSPPWAGRSPFFPRLRQNIVLRDARQLLEVHATRTTSPAAGWLVEHGNLLDQQPHSVRAPPRRYWRNCRAYDEPLAGLPRVYGIAWAFVAHTDGAFDEELLMRFLCAYQETRELELGEMWALPTTLRVVLIENLRRLAERAAACRRAACGAPLDRSRRLERPQRAAAADRRRARAAWPASGVCAAIAAAHG